MGTFRVCYREGQTLLCSDLDGEQAYRIAKRRRHNIAHHGWGIVAGLTLEVEAGRLVIHPGMAVDGYGRELIVPGEVVQPVDQIAKRMTLSGNDAGMKIYVWLLYACVPETPSHRGRRDCGPDRQSRWREEARVRLTLEAPEDKRRPPGVPEENIAFGPWQTPPDDPRMEWPVYLGCLTLNPKDGQDPIDMEDRPYIALWGEAATAASGRARIQLSGEHAGDRNRFKVCASDSAGVMRDYLTIDQEGNATIYANTSLKGNLVILEPDSKGADEIDPCHPCDRFSEEVQSTSKPVIPGIEFQPLAAVPETAAPWRIYRCDSSPDAPPDHQLRLEIEHPGKEGDPSIYGLAVGYHDGSMFKSCLRVSADCIVEVNGNLRVEGQVIQGPIEVDPNDPDFRETLENGWLLGLGEAGGKAVGAILGTSLEVEISAPSSVHINEELTYTVTVDNTGSGRLTSVNIYITVARDEDDAPSIKIPLPDLDPGKTRKYDGTYTPGETGTYHINITALAVGPAANLISDMATRSFTVGEIIM